MPDNSNNSETVRLAQDIGQIQGVLPSLATKEDVSKAALRTTLWIIGVIVTLVVGLGAAQVSVLMHILSRLPG